MADQDERNSEREALEALLASPGWAIFQRRVLEEWRGEGYFARMGMAVSGDDPLASKVVHGVSLEVEKMLKWPHERFMKLATPKAEKLRTRVFGHRGATPND